jgi:hypothetical protein
MLSRLEQMMAQLDDANRSSEQLNRVSYRLTSDVQALRGRIDTQNSQVAELGLELRNLAQKYDQDSRRAVSLVARRLLCVAGEPVGQRSVFATVATCGCYNFPSSVAVSFVLYLAVAARAYLDP